MLKRGTSRSKDRLVPIIADEARTFGMEGLFRQVVSTARTASSTPAGREQVAYYKKKTKGRNSAGRTSTGWAQASGWRRRPLTAPTSADDPVLHLYSMFGFQRIGDACAGRREPASSRLLIGGLPVIVLR